MPYKPEHAVAWTEIPVTDIEKAAAFYRAAMDFEITVSDDPPNPVGMISTQTASGVAGHLYPGKPGKGTGPTIHLNVAGTVEDATAKWVAAGGTKITDAIQIPPGRFAYVEDPDGNSIGLFEPAAA